MNLAQFRLVTFDVTNTLLKFRTSPGKQYGEIGAMYGILCDNNSLSANFKAHWRKMNQEHPNFGRNTGLGWEKWWHSIVKGTFKDSKFNLDDKKLDAIASHLIDAYKTSACWQPTYGVMGLLSYIRHKGIPMGVISNFDPRLETTLTNTKLRHYFNFVLTSYEAGKMKPDPAIFQDAMVKSNVNNLKGEDCLHIGDTAVLDYLAAKNVGWQAVLIDDRPPELIQKKHPEVNPDHLFTSLYHLHRYFLENAGEKLSAQSLI